MSATKNKMKSRRPDEEFSTNAGSVDITVDQANISALPKKKKQKKEVPSEPKPELALGADEAAAEAEAVVPPAEKPGPGKLNILSTSRFSSLPLSEGTQAALVAMGFQFMTKIQDKSIASLLAGKDLLGAAKTGSGKVLNLNMITLWNFIR